MDELPETEEEAEGELPKAEEDAALPCQLFHGCSMPNICSRSRGANDRFT